MVLTPFFAALAGSGAVASATSLYASQTGFTVQNQNVTFPEDLKSNTYIHMRFSSYQRRSIRQQPFFKPENSIRLPIPKNLIDSISVDYQGTSLGPLFGAAVDTAAEMIQRGGPQNFTFREALDSASSIGGGIASAVLAQSAQNYLSNTAVGAAANRALETGLQSVESLTGITMNPYQTVLFKSPKFKTHKFSWTFVPKTQKESNDIEFILRLFKYHMLPGISRSTALFFSYPEILEIKLFPKDDYLYRFKPCVVESVNVNYAPNSPSFYRASGAPTAIDFSISLQEIEIWTKADYERNELGRIPFRSFGPNRVQGPGPGSLAPNLRAGIE